MEPEEPVCLISEDTRDQQTEFDGAVWKIAAKATVYWPWKIACHLLGDPGLRNTEAFDHRRYDRHRVMQASGVILPQSVTEEEWQEMRPKILVQTMGGEKITMLSEMPIDSPVDFQTGFSNSDLKVRISELERTISQLTANIEENTPFVVTETSPNEKSVTSIDEIPEDTGGPRKSTRR
jgi:hypothetical protein